MKSLKYPQLKKISIRKRKIEVSPFVVNLSPEIAKWNKLNKTLLRRVK